MTSNYRYETVTERESRLMQKYKEDNIADYQAARTVTSKLVRRIVARNPGKVMIITLGLIAFIILFFINPVIARDISTFCVTAFFVSLIIGFIRKLYRWLASLKP